MAWQYFHISPHLKIVFLHHKTATVKYIFPQNHRGLKSSKIVLGREAKSLKNGIPTLCKGLQSNQSASPCRPPKQTNKTNKPFLKTENYPTFARY